MGKRAIAAYTMYPNTPESDMQKFVMHVVKMDDESTITVLATDPMDAIDKVNRAVEIRESE